MCHSEEEHRAVQFESNKYSLVIMHKHHRPISPILVFIGLVPKVDGETIIINERFFMLALARGTASGVAGRFSAGLSLFDKEEIEKCNFMWT